MRRFIPSCAIVAALTAGLAAQDSTVKSRTDVETDDAIAVSLTGCLRQDAITGRYTLAGTVAAAGEDVSTRTKVKTDVDDDDVEVKVTTKAEADDAVGTSGTLTRYVLVPRANVTLAPHVGKRVQVSAVMLEAGETDAEVEIKDKTNIDTDDAPDATRRSRTEIEIEGVPHGQYAVVSVKPLEGPCLAQ